MAKFNLFVKKIKENWDMLTTLRNLISEPTVDLNQLFNSNDSELRLHIDFTLEHICASSKPPLIEKWEISLKKYSQKSIRTNSMEIVCGIMLEILALMNSLIVLKNVAHDECIFINFHVIKQSGQLGKGIERYEKYHKNSIIRATPQFHIEIQAHYVQLSTAEEILVQYLDRIKCHKKIDFEKRNTAVSLTYSVSQLLNQEEEYELQQSLKFLQIFTSGQQLPATSHQQTLDRCDIRSFTSNTSNFSPKTNFSEREQRQFNQKRILGSEAQQKYSVLEPALDHQLLFECESKLEDLTKLESSKKKEQGQEEKRIYSRILKNILGSKLKLINRGSQLF